MVLSRPHLRVFYLTHNFALNLVEKTPLGNDGILVLDRATCWSRSRSRC